jgi:hypothetical protein
MCTFEDVVTPAVPSKILMEYSVSGVLLLHMNFEFVLKC